MRAPIFALAPLVAVVVALGAASAGAGANEFAAGSAKTDLAVVGGFGTALEHASFSAHSTGVGCEAKGHMVYKGEFGIDLIELEGDVEQLIIVGQRALLLVRITKQRGQGINFVGQIAGFDAFDSGLAGGIGDEFFFDFIGNPGCLQPPVPGHPITQGNIVIKATGPMLLP